MQIYYFIIIISMMCCSSNAFSRLHYPKIKNNCISTSKFPIVKSIHKTQLSTSSFILSTADFAAEIVEKSVGTEVYTPIFQAGIFLIGSGVVSCIIAVLIISKSDSWNDLELEFQKGKEKQLIDVKDMKPNNKITENETDVGNENFDKTKSFIDGLDV